MSKQVKSLGEWLDSLGYSNSVWLGGDWHQPLHLLSKLLANELNERRTIENQDQVSFKIGYDSLTKLAEETFGIPCLVTEKDLMVQYPNIFLAQLVYLVSLRHSLDRIDIKLLAATKAPKLVFEARNGNYGQFPNCPSCEEHVFFVERVRIESSVWHRSCFKCIECGEKLKNGGYKKTKAGYECIIHAVRKILDEKEPAKSPRPKVAPPAPPEKLSMEDLQVEIKHSATSSLASPGGPSSADVPSVCLRVKPVPPPKPKGLMSPKPPVVDESQSSCDSGFYSAMDTLTIRTENDHYDTIPNLPGAKYEAKESSAPVAPPRPKRASLLMTSAMTPPLTPQPRCSMASPNNPHVPPKPARRLPGITANSSPFVYPDNLCPFDEDAEDTQVNFAYDESKNPFADSDDEEDTPTPAPRTIFSPCVLGESDRPKIQPPPPPEVAPLERAFPASKLLSPVSDQDKLRTLRLSKKKFRAPLPPKMMKQRQIQFTENQIKDDSKLIKDKVEDLDDQIAGSERDGKNLEKELLFLVTTNPKDWFKMQKTDEYVSILTRLLDTIRQQTYLLYSWKEAFLNEIHAETESLLRCLVEKDLQDEYSINREKQLTSLLIFIIDEKAKLTESNIDNEEYGRSATCLKYATCDSIIDSSVTRKENKKKKLRLRLAILTKKLTHKKEK